MENKTIIFDLILKRLPRYTDARIDEIVKKYKAVDRLEKIRLIDFVIENFIKNK